MAEPMTLTDEDVGRIGEYVKPWLRQMMDELVPRLEPVGADTRLLERMVRVEEELKAQRTLMDEMARRFEAVDSRFDAVDKRFEDLIGHTSTRFEESTGHTNARFEQVIGHANTRFEDLIGQMNARFRYRGPALRGIACTHQQPLQDVDVDDRCRVRRRHFVDDAVRPALLSCFRRAAPRNLLRT